LRESPLRFRLLRLAAQLRLTPALSASAQLRPADAGGALLRVSVCLAEGGARRSRLRSLSALSQISGRGPPALRPLTAACAAQLLPSDGSPVSLFFGLGESEGDDAAHLSLDGSLPPLRASRGALGALCAASEHGDTLALLWECEADKDAPLCRGLALLAPSAAQEAPALRAVMLGCARHRHDFRSRPGGCVLSLSLLLQSHCDVELRPLLRLLSPGGAAGWEGAAEADASVPLGLPSAPACEWLGITVRRLPPLPPGGAFTAQLQLLVRSAGVHSLEAGWAISWEGLGGAGEQQRNAPFMVVVEDGADG